MQPIQNPKELDLTLAEVVIRLRDRRSYRRRFQMAFGCAMTTIARCSNG
ncbi:MAG: hypothetical protein O7G84_05000 [Gammaproteobacteria bacterium]|nr:hypothetical protein [Gammaproteobacteria bacterium]